MANISAIKLPSGTTYDIKDSISGYTTNTGTITQVKTTAGAHTTIDVSSGAATFNVPTKTSHLTNDSGFITASHTSTYSLPIAVYNTLGGVKPAYSTTGTATLTTSSQAYTNSPTIAARTTTSGKYYGIEIDSDGRLFVNVPWTDTKVTTNALTSETLYYPILATGTGTGTRQIDSTLKGLTYRSTAGTTSSVGTATLMLGNNVSSGTANNERGRLILYSSTNYYVQLQTESLSANRTITLPNKAGTLAIASDITDKKLEVNELTSGTLYYPILATNTGIGIRQIDSTLNGFTYKSTAGTTSTIGEACLTLGNNIAEGVANNEIGWIELFSNTSYRAALVAPGLTQNRSVQLPDKDGVLALDTIVIPGSSTTYGGLMSQADKTKLDNCFESVSLTQAEYDALSSSEKTDASKVYYITDAVDTFVETGNIEFNATAASGTDYDLATILTDFNWINDVTM